MPAHVRKFAAGNYDYGIVDFCPGKFALSNLVSYLPDDSHVSTDDAPQSSNETLCAVISTITDLVTDSIRTTKYVVAHPQRFILYHDALLYDVTLSTGSRLCVRLSVQSMPRKA